MNKLNSEASLVNNKLSFIKEGIEIKLSPPDSFKPTEKVTMSLGHGHAIICQETYSIARFPIRRAPVGAVVLQKEEELNKKTENRIFCYKN